VQQHRAKTSAITFGKCTRLTGSDIDAREPRPEQALRRAAIDVSNVRPLRRTPRQTVNIRALLYVGKTFQTTRIVDISAGGAGVCGALGLSKGDRIKLVLLDGRELNGVVQWWIMGRCGVAFLLPLAANDPILGALAAPHTTVARVRML
jgi:PilZ domain